MGKKLKIKFKYSESIFYMQFEQEIAAIMKIFEIKKIEYNRCEIMETMAMDRISPSNFDKYYKYYEMEPKLVFPIGTNKTLIKWLENVHKNLTIEETIILWNEISKHPELEKLSNKIWFEFKMLVENGEGWNIY